MKTKHRTIGVRPVWLCCTLIGSVALFTGCRSLHTKQTSIATAVQPEVKVSGGLALGEAARPAISPDEFVGRVQELLGAGQQLRARRFVERYPDVAIHVLRDVTTERASDGAIQFVAAVHDAQCNRSDTAGGWEAMLRDRAANPQKYAAFEKSRRQVAELLRAGKAREAAAVDIVPGKGQELQPVLELDAVLLTAEARILAGRPTDAVKALSTALERHGPRYPYLAMRLGLILSEAYRRCQQEAPAIHVWQTAVRLGSKMIDEQVADPALWEQSAALRPYKTEWPSAVAQHLSPSTGRQPSTEIQTASFKPSSAPAAPETEALLWQWIGRARLARREPEAALLAFKRAEVASQPGATQDALQLDKARALIDMNQPTAATALLAALSVRKEKSVCSPALAMLGSLKMKAGQLPAALALLRRGVAEDEGATWPGRTEAQADLGLAYLLCGDEENGLRWLHTARRGFADANDVASLIQCLENEAAYLERKKHDKEAKACREEAARLKGM